MLPLFWPRKNKSLTWVLLWCLAKPAAVFMCRYERPRKGHALQKGAKRVLLLWRGTNDVEKTMAIELYLSVNCLRWQGKRYFSNGACSVGYTGTRGIFGGRTGLTEVSRTGIEFVPNLTGVFGWVFRPYLTLPKTSVGNLPS